MRMIIEKGYRKLSIYRIPPGHWLSKEASDKELYLIDDSTHSDHRIKIKTKDELLKEIEEML